MRTETTACLINLLLLLSFIPTGSTGRAQAADTTKMLGLARKLDSEGRASEAVKLYDRVLSQNMNSLSLLYESIEVRERAQQRGRLEDLNRIAASDPLAKKYPNIYNYRAAALLTDNQEEAALKDCFLSRKLGKDNASTAFTLCRVYQSRGEQEKALKELDQAILRFPIAKQAYPHKLRALNLEALKRDKEALEEWNVACKLTPTPEEADLTNRARLCERLGKNQQALADYTSLLALKADNEFALEKRGRLYFKIGKYKECVADLSKSLKLDEDAAPSTAELLAAAYEKLGMKKEAAQEMARAKKIRDRM